MKIPENEAKRLETLLSLNVLDTQPEERFDRLTRLTKRLFNVPMAMVSLIDAKRQWFKSKSGIEINETPRDISFCAHSILGNEVFVVPDALVDERFADNPLVLNEPHYRFYAGCPLKAPNGQKLGALCIVDNQPRYFAEEDIQMLKDLASIVERELAAVQIATHDELTGIVNRRGFLMLSEQNLRLCAREKIPASLIFIDLDKLKPINDNFGHVAGDTALSVFADLMKKACRDSDIFARLGGDEFVILLSNASYQDANNIMLRQQALLKQYNETSGLGYDIQFSYGVTEFNP